MPRIAAPIPPPTETPIYWFLKLELAMDDNDFEKAAEAKCQLARLGVEVHYSRQTITASRGGFNASR